MDTTTREMILAHWQAIRAYSVQLVDDLAEEDMVAQPVKGVVLNHPSWIVSHLSVYGTLLASILQNRDVADPIDHRYGRQSRPEANPKEYLPKNELLKSFLSGYDEAAESFRTCPSSRFAEPTPVARWRERFPTIGYLPVQFLIKHTSTHLGQLSAWRRAGGRPSV